MPDKTALVVTSISGPNAALAACAEGSKKHGVDFIVIGDAKTPADFNLPGSDFWSIDRQRIYPSCLAQILPQHHYARKNIGYLVAIGRGAEVIIETDDDNFPLDTFWEERSPIQSADLIEGTGWVNIYNYFTDASIWPRGLPLEFIGKSAVPDKNRADLYCPIQQGLVNDNPDVDAVYRLTMPLPHRFSSANSIALGRDSWSPFNSQNTAWFKAAFPLLYIPSHCSFRMCDIWRSFIALRICQANDWKVLFHGPTACQERNEHDLLKDFSDEIPGYLNNTRICTALAALGIKRGSENIAANLRRCYQVLIGFGLIHQDETRLLDAWLEDIRTLL